MILSVRNYLINTKYKLLLITGFLLYYDKDITDMSGCPGDIDVALIQVKCLKNRVRKYY
jgi:hypothetical protein